MLMLLVLYYSTVVNVIVLLLISDDDLDGMFNEDCMKLGAKSEDLSVI